MEYRSRLIIGCEQFSGNELLLEERKEIIKSNSFQFERSLNERFKLQLYSAQSSHFPLFTLGSRLAYHFGFKSKGVDSEYVTSFLELLFSFSKRKRSSFQDFCRYWDKKHDKLYLSTPKTPDAIRVLTIHKSKGLEFPIVVMPYLSWDAGKGKGNFLFSSKAKMIPVQPAFLSLNNSLENTVLSEELSKKSEDAFIENLNLIYVAFTRAKTGLIVNIKADSIDHDGKYGKVEKVVLQGLVDSDYNLEEALDPHNNPIWKLRLGQVHTKTKQEIEKEPSKEKRDLGPRKPDLRLRIEKGLIQDGELVLSPRQKGNVIHSLLQKVEHRDDLKPLGDNLKSQGFSQTEVEQIVSGLQHVISDPKISSLFESGVEVYNERDLYTGSEIQRADRIVKQGDNWVVLDYKTGQETKKNINQVLAYAKTLRKAMNLDYDPKAFLLYLGDDPKVVECVQ